MTTILILLAVCLVLSFLVTGIAFIAVALFALCAMTAELKHLLR